MTASAVRFAEAASDKDQTHPWYLIDWEECEKVVEGLQRRIVEAVKAGNWRRVSKLQGLLVHSFSAKALAVRRVSEDNGGRHTPGVDRIVWDSAESKYSAIFSLETRGYKAIPLRRKGIPKKGSDKVRYLGIPAMKDRAMQMLYQFALDPVVEVQSDRNSYGFRKERCAWDAIAQLHTVLCHQDNAKWVLEGDIKGCFDNIGHQWLLEHVPMFKPVLKQWLEAGFVDETGFHETDSGTPQGGIISPTLANCALNGLEAWVETKAKGWLKARGIKRVEETYKAMKVNVVRYADDFVITGDSKEFLRDGITPIVKEFLGERGLELQMQKTHITHIHDGFDFLGFNIRKYVGKSGRAITLTKPSKDNMKASLEKIRGVLKEGLHWLPTYVIMRLNPIIKGWAQYHRFGAATASFVRYDWQVFRALMYWARRRHNDASKDFLHRKYFLRRGQRRLLFGVKHGRVLRDGRIRNLYLALATDLKCSTRWSKIRGDANPYDAEYEEYFIQRQRVKMEKSQKGRRLMLKLWRRQDHNCLVCRRKLDRIGDGYTHIHHVWDKEEMGKWWDSDLNKALLHRTCHLKAHRNPQTFQRLLDDYETLLEAKLGLRRRK
jgi:RNA-directed DNA polymerase